MVKLFHRTVWAVRDLRGLWSSLWPLSSPCPCTTVLIVKKHFQCVSLYFLSSSHHAWLGTAQIPPLKQSPQVPRGFFLSGASIQRWFSEYREALLTTSFHATVYCWLILTLLFTRTPGSSLQSFYPVPGLHLCQGLFLPRCRTLHLSQMDFIMFPSAHSSLLSRCL